MPEHQTIEYKSSWHEEYLDWICGFANAQGGKIHSARSKLAFNDLIVQTENKAKRKME